MTLDAPRQRLRIVCRGVVQGVGFRPAVHRLATSLALAGWVRNGPDGVEIEVEGAGKAVRSFIQSLPRSLPALARLDEMDAAPVPPTGGDAFEVLASEPGRRQRALVPPDAALCADCRAEMDDPEDRRHRYPFTTCTNCGPRFTLVRSLPYDRERTSMACFALCPDCRREYTDPANRRFHAEPVCCPACGPRLWVEGPGAGVKAQGAEALRLAREALAKGVIVAVKGFGGFQLSCRADNEGVVAQLRECKRRPTKPFALMVRDLGAARRLVALGPDDEALLASPRAPVLLAPRLADAPVAGGIAPGLSDLGVMLPTAPLHVELFRDTPFDALVMTSGNASDEPICRTNRDALERLAGIADLFLLHDRDVVRRADDSVARTSPGGPAMVRRARGYVPEALPLPVVAPVPVLAMGPFLQVTTCLAVGEEAFCSQHVGDLDTEKARAFHAEVAEGLETFLEAEGELIVVDPHPDYPSTWLGQELARERSARLLPVQHHLAHAAAVLAEHGRFPGPGERAAAVALDGTGWGPDGTAWGGEWLLLDGELGWSRLAHLDPFPLVGGEAAVREPWRVAAVALASAGAAELLGRLPMARLVPLETMVQIVELAGQPTWPRASGAGRLFEAGGALLGLATVNGYEGEAAARLEALAQKAWPAAPWVEVRPAARASLPVAALLAAAARRVAGGEDPARVAAGFHATFCRLAVELTARVVPPAVRVVALGGGCLVNRLLRRGLGEGLADAGFEPLLPSRLPPGDGGVSYGQAVLGAVAAARGVEPSLKGEA
ncbi:MAG TPA: carbamoyltransferase HypF [Thermoanaerobaculaceae bacterium]|nr:carbamoyltransferase HypF [Thermoanaerobaculaceae bacterium]